MVNQILADGMKAFCCGRHHDLGAHAVGRADQNRLFVFFGVEPEKPAKTAQVAQHVFVEGRADIAFHAPDGFLPCVNVDAGVLIGDAFNFHNPFFNP
jgi:hypothetical protein